MEFGEKQVLSSYKVQLTNICYLKAYEQEKMVPAPTNRNVAGYTIAEMLHSVPSAFGIKAFATRIVICCLEERVRISMMFVNISQYSPNTHSSIFC